MKHNQTKPKIGDLIYTEKRKKSKEKKRKEMAKNRKRK